MTEPQEPATTPDALPVTPAADPPKPADDKGPVPYHRFVEVLRERDDFRAKYEGASSADRALTEARAEAERIRAELNAERNGRLEDRAFYGAGLTDADAQDVARLLYGKLAEKPDGGLSAWLKGITEAPDAAPVPLRPYIAKPAMPPAPAPKDGGTPSGPQRATVGDVTAEALRSARERAKATGDWSEFDALTAQVPKRR